MNVPPTLVAGAWPSQLKRAANTRPGTVYLLGAGPGDPELITVRGHRLLAAADVVVYDRLVHPALLALVAPEAETIFAGKAAGIAVLAQAQIERLLIDRARRGLVVVRLKGGDPFVFGRGSEEALALARAGIAFEVVPAVSSAFGVPASAGIPLTHRGLAASFAVVTAHRKPGADGQPWPALAQIDTLVVLMGVAALEEVAATLIANGRAPTTPAAVVERGSLPEQRVTRAELAAIAVCARVRGVRAPATLVVGAVASLGDTLRRAARCQPQLDDFTTAAATDRQPPLFPGGTRHVR